MDGDESRERDDLGRYASDLSTEQVLSAVPDGDPAKTSTIAEEVDAPRSTVLKYLDELAEADEISKLKPTPHLALWKRAGTNDPKHTQQ